MSIVNGLLNNLTSGISTGGIYTPPTGLVTMDSVAPDSYMDLDATVTQSYGGTGDSWTDLIGNLDMVLKSQDGSSEDKPQFIGTAGDSAAYFEMQGSGVGEGVSWFETSAVGASLPDVIKSLGHSDIGFVWMTFAINFNGTHTTALCSTTGATNTTSGLFIDLNINSPYVLRNVSEGTGGVVIYSTGSNVRTVTDPYDTDVLLTYKFQKRDGLSIAHTVWVNGVQTYTINSGTPVAANEADPEGAFRLFRDNDTQKNNPNGGSKVRAFSMGFDNFDQTMMDAQKTLYNIRHGGIYT